MDGLEVDVELKEANVEPLPDAMSARVLLALARRLSTLGFLFALSFVSPSS